MDLMPDRGSASRRLFHSTPWIRSLAAAWDASGNWWEESVVRFNMASQLNLMQRLGLGEIDYPGMALLLLAAATTWGLLVALWTMRSTRAAGADALGATWLRYRALLRRRGMDIARHEPPRAIARRVAGRYPLVAAQVNEFTEQYLALRYGVGAHISKEQVRPLRTLLRRIAGGTARRRQNRPRWRQASQ